LGSAALGFHIAEVLSDGALSQSLFSPKLWEALVALCGGRVRWSGNRSFADLDSMPIVAGSVVLGTALWLLGGSLLALTGRHLTTQALARFGWWGWLWWLLPVAFGACDLLGASGMLGTDFPTLLRGSLPFWNAALVAGWGATWVTLAFPDAVSQAVSAGPRVTTPLLVWLGMSVYFLVFSALNWRLYDSLLLPHGDSAMYEEHLWNLLNGKGFRSYLDNGRLFLGEHVQVVHLLLVPLYLLWPSHVLLELAQSAALALGAIAVYRIAHRQTASRSGATLLALAYLLYFPLQFLDIAIDFKTFRPNSFEIPFFLFALDALETRRFRALAVWLVLALSCQEDAATIIAPLGLWIALRLPAEISVEDIAVRRQSRWLGWGLAAGGVAWVLLVIKVILPWFRGGADVHFAQYFSTLGDSTDSIISAVVRHPDAVIARLLRAETGLFAIALLAPLGWLPVFSPGRLAVAAPLFCVLCLSDITDSPQHHFHAPLVPVLFWAAAHGMRPVCRWIARIEHLLSSGRSRKRQPAPTAPARLLANGRRLKVTGASAAPAAAGSVLRLLRMRRRNEVTQPRDGRFCVPVATWVFLNALVTGAWIGLSPLSISFWDPHSSAFWRNTYIPGDRARHVVKVLEQIPKTARVASTDLVHTRLTHYERSYDYSEYRPVVPVDADFIVIDAKAPHSQVRGPRDIKELRDEPGRWKLLPDQTEGHFLILQRVRPAGGRQSAAIDSAAEDTTIIDAAGH